MVSTSFAQMLAPLQRGQFDAAWLPEPFLTMALGRGATQVANAMDAVCARCLLTMWLARKDIDANLAARFRNAMQAAAVWANQKRNDRASGEILARYADRQGCARENDPDAVRGAAPARVVAAVDRRLRRVRRDPGVVSRHRPRPLARDGMGGVVDSPSSVGTRSSPSSLASSTTCTPGRSRS